MVTRDEYWSRDAAADDDDRRIPPPGTREADAMGCTCGTCPLHGRPDADD